MKHMKTLFLGAAAITAMACSPEAEDTTPAGSAPLVMNAKMEGGVQAAPSFAPAGQNISFGKDITVTSVKVVVANINLHGREGNEIDDDDRDDMKKDGDDDKKKDFAAAATSTIRTGSQVKFTGPYVLDLTSGTFTPSLLAVTIPVGHYKKFDMTFQTLTAAEADEMSLSVSDPVIGHSFVIEGWLNNVTLGSSVTDETIKFRIVGNQDEHFNVSLKKGFTVTHGTLNDLLLVFNATGWFPSNLIGQLRSELDEDSIVVDAVTGERILVIDASQGTASQFKKLFRKSVRFVHDLNHDREVAADEEGDSVGE